jgi:hypothetical protein
MKAAPISVALAVAAVCCGFAATDASGATPSGVTIHVKHAVWNPPNHRFYGYVFSRDPKRCADGRTVKVFKQRGRKPRPKSDTLVGRRVAFKSGGKYRWALGTPRDRIRHGKRYYAWIGRERDCERDKSRTIRVRAH